MPASARQYLLSLEQIGIKLGLEQIRTLLTHLDRPDLAYRSIVIAGTNGKGSVTAMLERGLRAAGYRTGRYTSPHLVHLEERFALDGQAIPSDRLEAAAARVRAIAGRLSAPPTFFEATTALALDMFRDAKVDVAVLEVGLGGRLDATNVVHPVGVAITSIDFDHEQYLGDTIEAIAREKAGVIKPDSVVVLANNAPVVHDLVARAAADAGADFVFAPDGVGVEAVLVEGRAHLSLRTPRDRYDAITLALRGRHQVDNAVTAVRLLEALAARGSFSVQAPDIRTALTDVEWPGRLELVGTGASEVLLDGAHNPGGARSLAAYVLEAYGRRLPVVLGAMRDKKFDEMITAIAPAASHFICTAPATPRAAEPAELASAARKMAPSVPALAVPGPLAALACARGLGTPVVVAGSLYLVGEIRAEIS